MLFILLYLIMIMSHGLSSAKIMDNKKIEKISRALSDASRIAILQEFKKKKDCLYCAEINDLLDMTQPSVSHHIKQLVDADLLLPKKEGRNLKYVLNQQVLNDYIASLNELKD
jgi:ArsR family transcriptional regulator